MLAAATDESKDKEKAKNFLHTVSVFGEGKCFPKKEKLYIETKGTKFLQVEYFQSEKIRLSPAPVIFV